MPRIRSAELTIRQKTAEKGHSRPVDASSPGSASPAAPEALIGPQSHPAALRLPSGVLTSKPNATPEAARRLAARLDPQPIPGGCRHCGGHTEPGRLACAWCRRVLDGER